MQYEKMESVRLSFRRIGSKDFDFLFRYHSDPEMTKYLPLGKPYPQDKVEEYLENRIKHWIQHQFGTFLLLLKSTGEVVGYCGLEYVKDTALIDIRYGVIRDMWGVDIAKEAAQRCIEFGFNDLDLTTIYGAAEPGNVPSLIILNKIGMRPCKDVDFYGDAVQYFKIIKSDYLKLHA